MRHLDRLLDFTQGRTAAGCKITSTVMLAIGGLCLIVGSLIDGPVG